MKANQAEHEITMMCRLLEVSASGYHAWVKRPASKRTVEDRRLTQLIVEIWSGSHRTYGAPRIHAELADRGVRVGRKRVARLMKTAGIVGLSPKKRFVPTTIRDSDPSVRPAPDLVARNFCADAPNRIWVADITEIPNRQGPLYLACVEDVWSRRIVGWAINETMTTSLVIAALDMAVNQRRPEQVVHHSDQGSQYTSIAFGLKCHEHGIAPSMGSVGDCYDNAMIESCFATLELEVFARNDFTTRADAQAAVINWIEGWYNPTRRHSSINNLSPNEYERRHWPS